MNKRVRLELFVGLEEPVICIGEAPRLGSTIVLNGKNHVVVTLIYRAEYDACAVHLVSADYAEALCGDVLRLVDVIALPYLMRDGDPVKH